MTSTEVLVAVAIAIGLVGIVMPLLPGSLLVLAAIVAWSAEVGGVSAWAITGVAAVLILTGVVVKYLVPGKRLKDSGVPSRDILLGAALGVVGFFVVPFLGLPLGFVVGIYLAQWRRVGRARAWAGTLSALKAIGLGMLIEFGFAFLATMVWAIGVVIT